MLLPKQELKILAAAEETQVGPINTSHSSLNTCTVKTVSVPQQKSYFAATISTALFVFHLMLTVQWADYIAVNTLVKLHSPMYHS